MKRVFYLFGVFVMVLGMLAVSHATSIDFTQYTITLNNEFISAVAPTAEDFNGSLVWAWTGNFNVLTGSSGINAAPMGANNQQDASKYITVPKSMSSTLSATATLAPLGTYYNYFGLWWGSVDEYNTISFLKDGVVVDEYTGKEVIKPNAADGDQDAPGTNLYVNFLYLPDFNGITITSTQYAFEADNMAIAKGSDLPSVPVPPTVWLLGSGLLGLVGLRRKFRK